jgi:hypothetical protein
MTFGSSARLVFITLIGFLFAYFEHRSRTLQATHAAILGRRFHHICVHHYYIAKVAVSTLTLLRLLRHQWATSAFSLLVALHTTTILETFAGPLNHRRLFKVVFTFVCPVLATLVRAFIHDAFLGLANSVHALSLMVSTLLTSASSLIVMVPRLFCHLHPRCILALPLLCASAPVALVRLPRHRQSQLRHC